MTPLQLLIQPGSGVDSLVAAIDQAQTSVEIAIFRFDLPDLERALESAIARGVIVHALVAQANHGGNKRLRQLEMRLLDAGATVSRTASDLIRYHAKYVVIDRRSLWVLGYNLTRANIFGSRSFGIVTAQRTLVDEAIRPFDADATRQPYAAAMSDLVVSPENARDQLSRFIEGARKELLVYDPHLSDAKMVRLCQQRMQAGVDVRIIGGVGWKGAGLHVRKLHGVSLHVRAIVRDGSEAFIGSQSLRGIELDGRREVGVIVHNRRIAGELQGVFEADWAAALRTRVRHSGAGRYARVSDRTDKHLEVRHDGA